MLQEQHLGGAGFVGKAGLRFLAFFAAKGRIGEHDIKQGRRALKQAAVGFLPGERIAMPEVRLVNAVQHQVGQGDRVDQVFFFAPVKGAVS